MPRVVRLVKQKLNGGSGSWLTYYLGDDEHGSWLFHPEGTKYMGRAADGREIECFSGVPEAPGCPVLHFVPAQGGWVAQWRYTPSVAITVDLSRPVNKAGDVWSFLDLELDLWHPRHEATPDEGESRMTMRRGGKYVGFADDDELADAVAHGQISDAEAAQTRDEARQVAEWLLDGIDPFGTASWDRFDAAMSMGLAAPGT